MAKFTLPSMTALLVCAQSVIIAIFVIAQIDGQLADESSNNSDKINSSSLAGNIIPQNRSLLEVISLAENVRSGEIKDESVYGFLNGTTQQAVLTRQILTEDDLLRAPKNGSRRISILSGITDKTSELLVQRHLIDEMMLFLDSLFLIGKSIVIFTDKSELGGIALTRIFQRCIESNRKIAAFKTVSMKTNRETILQHMKSDLFVLDCDGKIAEKLLHFAKEMGYTGYRDNVHWVLSHRTMSSLPMSCSLPVARCFGVEAVFGITDAKASVPLQNCQAIKRYKDKVHCERKYYNVKDVIVKQLWKNPSGENGNVWLAMKSSAEADNSNPPSESIYPTTSHLNPFWPRFRVAVADTFQPWITIIDFSKTITDLSLCGLSGKYGHRYVNSTTNVTSPICAYGVAIDIIRHLEDTLEIECMLYVSRDGLYGNYNATSGIATGLIKEVSSGAADFAVDLLEDPSRRKAVEFTTPYEVTYHGIAYVHRSKGMASGVFSPFSVDLWLVTFAALFGLTLFLWTFEKSSETQRSEPTSEESRESFNIIDSMEYIWGTMCCGEIILNKPIGVGGRMLSVFASFFFIVLVAYYSAELISSLVVTDDTPLISGLKDILDYGNQVGTQRATGTANYLQNHHNVKVRQLFAKMQIFDSYQQSIDALKSRKVKFFLSDYLSLSITAQKDKDCTFSVIKADSNFAYLGMLFQKGSPLKRKLNVAAAGMTASGVKDRIFNFWFTSDKCSTSNEVYPLELSHFKNLFIFSGYGILGCLCILILSLSWKLACRLYRKLANRASENLEPL